MQLEPLLARLAGYPAVVRALTLPLSADDARWRPPEGGWSVLEIACHLADEEALDFRRRLADTLEDPGRTWAPIDPEGDVERLGYNARDLSETLSRFEEERTATVAWLRSVEAPDWSRTHHHPAGWRIGAGDLLVSLAAHDALHLRQLARRLFDLAQRDVPGCATGYAGKW